MSDRLLRIDIKNEQTEKLTIIVSYGPSENEAKEILFSKKS